MLSLLILCKKCDWIYFVSFFYSFLKTLSFIHGIGLLSLFCSSFSIKTPPFRIIVCPVKEHLPELHKQLIKAAISRGCPNLFIRTSYSFWIHSLEIFLRDSIGVSTGLGATELTVIWGANSLASALVSRTTPALETQYAEKFSRPKYESSDDTNMIRPDFARLMRHAAPRAIKKIFVNLKK